MSIPHLLFLLLFDTSYITLPSTLSYYYLPFPPPLQHLLFPYCCFFTLPTIDQRIPSLSFSLSPIHSNHLVFPIPFAPASLLPLFLSIT